MNYESFKKAWEKCIENNKNLCEKSTHKCAECIKLKKFDYKNEILIFHNKCDFNCDLNKWKIKDEGRKNFVFKEFVLEKEKSVKVIVSKEEFTDSENEIFWKRKDYVWTDSGDTLFLRDNQGGLVIWKNY